MSVKLDYSCDNTQSMIFRKMELADFRRQVLGGSSELQREAVAEDRKTEQLEINAHMRNPMEVFSKKNNMELDEKLEMKGHFLREWIDDAGVNQTLYRAPTNDIEGVRNSNTNALKLENIVNTNPALVAQQSTAESLKKIRGNRMATIRMRARMKTSR